MVDIFKNTTTSLPKSDPQIVRIDMDQSDIGGRKSAMPGQEKSDKLSVSHIPNAGGSK
jgi:hypothetical protein